MVLFFSVALPTHQSLILGPARVDHEILTRAMENAHRLLRGERPPDAAQQFAHIQQILAERIQEHFAYEENQVFPALLTNNPGEPVAQVIAELLTDHRTLLTAAQRLAVRLQQRSLADCTNEIWIEIMDFFSDFYTHVVKEDQLFKAVP